MAEEQKRAAEQPMSKEKAAKEVDAFIRGVNMINGGAISDISFLKNGFWEGFWKKLQLPKEKTPTETQERFLGNVVKAFASLEANGLEMTRLRNFFRIPVEHPILTKEDLSRLTSGQKTQWQEKQNSKATSNSPGTGANNRTGENHEASVRSNEAIREKYRPHFRDVWNRFWQDKVRSGEINSNSNEELRWRVLIHGMGMIAAAVRENFPVAVLPVIGDELIKNLSETPVSNFKNRFQLVTNDQSLEPFLTIPALNDPRAQIYESLFQRIFISNAAGERLTKEQRLKLRRAFLTTFHEANFQHYTSKRKTLFTMLAKFVNAGYDKYVASRKDLDKPR